MLFLLAAIAASAIEPSAPTGISVVRNESPNPTVGGLLNTSGGTIATVSLNVTTQNYRWKGYVGNITGTLALQDSSLSSLFSWDIVTTTGEIYATRNSSLPDWESIDCVTDGILSTEEDALNITTTEVDSINQTFGLYLHDAFYIGSIAMDQDSCRSVALNVNGTIQASDFQEVLLTDGVILIYAALIENTTYGFDQNLYDFQVILPENALLGGEESTAYYFYVELV